MRSLAFALLLFFSLIIGACSPGLIEAAGENTPTGSNTIATLSSETVPSTSTANPSNTAAPTQSPSPSATPTPLVQLPSPTEPTCLDRGGRIESGLELHTELLPLPLEYRVYLPPCYAQNPEQQYPVLYLIHGQSFNDDQWDRLGIDETADRLIGAGEISPLIVVMPRDRVWSQPAEDKFGQAVAEALLPWIDENYRTTPEREGRAVGGLSRGAGWALHLGLSRWESFGAIGMHSLPVFWTDLPTIKTWLDSIPREELPHIYIDSPDKDRPQIAKSTAWFEELLTEKSIPHEWHLFTGYHDEAYWEAHVEDYLRWYTREW